MTNRGAARTLLVLGRLVAFAAAALGVVLMVGQGHQLLRYAFLSRNPMWGEVGVLPAVFALRLAVTGWVAWAIVKLDGRALTRVLVAAFGLGFLPLYGWYFLLIGMDDALLYWIVTGDFLYLAGGALVLSARAGDGHA